MFLQQNAYIRYMLSTKFVYMLIIMATFAKYTTSGNEAYGAGAGGRVSQLLPLISAVEEILGERACAL
jgi:hypothetical protein